MNKMPRSNIAIGTLMVVALLAISPKFVFAQEATVTTTEMIISTITQTPTSTVTRTPTPTITPTLTPLATSTPTLLPSEVTEPQPTPISIGDIRSEFEDDFTNINQQLTDIYQEVHTSPGEWLIQGLVVEFLADIVKPSEQTNNAIYLVTKLLGLISIFIKVVLVVVRVTTKKDETVWYKLLNNVFTFILIVYAAVFMLILWYPSALQQATVPETPAQRDPSLTQIQDKLDLIQATLNRWTTQPPSTNQATSGNVDLGIMENQLAAISQQLDQISAKNESQVIDVNNKIDNIEIRLEEARSQSAKRGLQWLTVFLLLLLLVLSLIRGDLETVVQRMRRY